MKKWISGLIILVVAIAVGGWLYVDHANQETTYRTNLDKGNVSLKNQDYHQAKTDFKKALSAKPDSHLANGSVSQVEKFMDGERELKANDFQTAKDSFQMVANAANGSTDLAKQAQQKVELINSVNQNIQQFNEIYKTAVEQHNAKSYALSNGTLSQILQDEQIKQAYYEDVVVKANDLKKSNDKALNVKISKPVNQVTNSDASSVSTNVDPNNETDLSKFNVYTNPQEYANRFTDSDLNSTPAVGNNSNGPDTDPYNVYTNPEKYANRFN
ncbi:hypothetical protein [Fructilactobacillus frigidiflavus]|uniref:hypothetical protein n=1 Tax=Fructilactobacillus frigidiflavus TaxID=3242688 RepID=UPI0037565845